MLDEAAKMLAQGRNFAALTTLFPDGRPQTQVMWVHADDDHVLINTEVHRAKFKNTSNDPRVTVTVMDAENPYHYVEVRGHVAEFVRGDEALENYQLLRQKYRSKNYSKAIEGERVILKIEVEQAIIH